MRIGKMISEPNYWVMINIDRDIVRSGKKRDEYSTTMIE